MSDTLLTVDTPFLANFAASCNDYQAVTIIWMFREISWFSVEAKCMVCFTRRLHFHMILVSTSVQWIGWLQRRTKSFLVKKVKCTWNCSLWVGEKTELYVERLDRCFSTFVTPRPGKLFFYKTRARGPTNLLVNTFPIILSSYINLA
jgi:hypothetical protein